MKNVTRFAIPALALGAVLATGCTSTRIYDPTSEKTGIRDTRAISHEEMRDVAIAAVRNALVSPKFNRYVERFRADHGGKNPVLKLDRTINDTNDPDLNTSALTDVIFEELLNSDKVEVTLAEGAGRTQAIANSRANAVDPNFDQSTVAKQGRLVAANLLMRPKVVSKETRDGSTRNIERFFVMDLAEIDQGLVMWKYSKPLGFVTNRSTVGW